jgi:hypothetical protein
MPMPCITGGNDIFDAIAGKPGTVLTFDSHGQMGFRFDIDLWSVTKNFIDNIVSKANSPGQPDRPGIFDPPVGSFQVIERNLGTYTTVEGLIPDLMALQQEQNRLGLALSKVSLAGTQFAGAGNLLHLLMSNDYSLWGAIEKWAIDNFPETLGLFSALSYLQIQQESIVFRVGNLFQPN